MKQGVIVSLAQGRGFGSIGVEGEQDVYFHHSALATGLFEGLRLGQSVEFECQADPREPGRLQANNVWPRQQA